MMIGFEEKISCLSSHEPCSDELCVISGAYLSCLSDARLKGTSDLGVFNARSAEGKNSCS